MSGAGDCRGLISDHRIGKIGVNLRFGDGEHIALLPSTLSVRGPTRGCRPLDAALTGSGERGDPTGSGPGFLRDRRRKTHCRTCGSENGLPVASLCMDLVYQIRIYLSDLPSTDRVASAPEG